VPIICLHYNWVTRDTFHFQIHKRSQCWTAVTCNVNQQQLLEQVLCQSHMSKCTVRLQSLCLPSNNILVFTQEKYVTEIRHDLITIDFFHLPLDDKWCLSDHPWSRRDWPSFDVRSEFIGRSVHARLQVYVQGLWSVLPWLTSRQTYIHYFISQPDVSISIRDLVITRKGRNHRLCVQNSMW